MSRTFFSSDLHFLHQKNFLFEPRGFSSIEEHDREIIKNWNKTVEPSDIVFLLGDVYMTDNHEEGCKLLNQLNGNIFLIRGNHDSDNKINAIMARCPRVEVVGYSTPLKYKHYNFFLCHYPCLVSNYDADKPLKDRTIAICGHTHHKDKWHDFDKGLVYHVELDAHNNKPKLIDEIISEIKEKI